MPDVWPEMPAIVCVRVCFLVFYALVSSIRPIDLQCDAGLGVAAWLVQLRHDRQTDNSIKDVPFLLRTSAVDHTG